MHPSRVNHNQILPPKNTAQRTSHRLTHRARGENRLRNRRNMAEHIAAQNSPETVFSAVHQI